MAPFDYVKVGVAIVLSVMAIMRLVVATWHEDRDVKVENLLWALTYIALLQLPERIFL